MAELGDIPVVSGEVLDAVEDVTSLPLVRVFLLGLGVGLVGGAALGWWYTKRSITEELREEYKEQAEEEISQMREHFRRKVVAVRGREATARPVEEVVEAAGYVSTHKTPPEHQERETRNVFTEAEQAAINEVTKDADEGWDYEQELLGRRGEEVYIIHEDEKGEKGYETTTLTYYEGDGVLSEEGNHDHIVEEGSCGDEFMTKFGHGSSDPSIVWVRNDKLRTDFEICHSPDSYAEIVHGFRHSDETFSRRRRRDPHDE